MMKCPFCGKNTIGKIPPIEGSTGFFLGSVNANTNPPSVNPAAGIDVNLSGCASCGTIFVHNQKLINRQLVRE